MTIEPRGAGDAEPRPESGVPAEPDQTVEAVMQEAVSAAARQLVESATGSGRRPVWVLNGPNLGRLGKREPSVYGAMTYAQLADRLIAAGDALGLDVSVQKVEDYPTIMGYGVMSTPALVVDEQVLFSGRVPRAAQLRETLARLAS